jgi:tetratricopeptide (TPR) repeat protein
MLEIVRSFDPSAPADLQSQEILKLYLHFLNKYKTLILLDNAKDRSQVEPLNHANALVLITSRTIFNVSGGVSLEIQQMSIEDARLLLYSVANEARFEGTADTLADLAGYLPMALLPLASILADDRSVEATDLVEKYSDRKERLRLEDPNRGNISVEASFDLSYGRLTDELKACWRRLSIFPSDFDLEAMQTVWTVDRPKAIRSELTKSHLLTFDADSKRSSLHALARDYALGQMTENELYQTRTLHSAHYGALVKKLDTVTLQNLAVFDVERTNIEAGFDWVEKNLTKDQQFAELCTHYTGYASDLLFQRISFEEMERWQQAGLFAYRKLGNRIGEAYSESNLARISSYKGQHFKAIGGFKRALSKVEGVVPAFEGEWLGNLANVYTRLQRYQNSIRYHKKALEVAKRLGNRSAVARHLSNLGFTYLNLAKKEADLGHDEKAKHILESAFTSLKEALEIEEITITSKGLVIELLSMVYAVMGAEEKAESFRAEAAKIKEALETPSSRILRMPSESVD